MHTNYSLIPKTRAPSLVKTTYDYRRRGRRRRKRIKNRKSGVMFVKFAIICN
jgi:hypothetical protein